MLKFLNVKKMLFKEGIGIQENWSTKNILSFFIKKLNPDIIKINQGIRNIAIIELQKNHFLNRCLYLLIKIKKKRISPMNVKNTIDCIYIFKTLATMYPNQKILFLSFNAFHKK
jgi:hypothetical protein